MPYIYVPSAMMATNFVGDLDAYPGATGIWSTRRLRSGYTGAALRVRRSSDNSELDIGFVGEDLNTSALTSFVGANNGFVRTLYDQSGASRDMQQVSASLQPQLVSSGTVITTIGGRPSLLFDGINYQLSPVPTLGTFITADAGTVFSVFRVNTISTTDADTFDNEAVWADAGGFAGVHLHNTTPDLRAYNWDGTDDRTIQTIALATDYAHAWRHASGNIDSFLLSDTPTTIASGNTTTLSSALLICASFGSQRANCWVAEMVTYNTGLSTGDVGAIGDLMAAYYGLTWT